MDGLISKGGGLKTGGALKWDLTVSTCTYPNFKKLVAGNTHIFCLALPVPLYSELGIKGKYILISIMPNSFPLISVPYFWYHYYLSLQYIAFKVQ